MQITGSPFPPNKFGDRQSLTSTVAAQDRWPRLLLPVRSAILSNTGVILTLVISWTGMVAPPPSLTSPRRWRKWVEEKREKKLLCHFIHEGKPSPVIFTSISLTISSYKRTEIKFVAFMASMMEVGMRWEKWKLGDANQVLVDLKIFLSHIIISAYFLKPCKHILS